MSERRIGDTVVSAIGLGAMPLSVEGRPDERHTKTFREAPAGPSAQASDPTDAGPRTVPVTR
ncbi:hypothetical protein ABIA32_005594 [Streptacidiphilus sp. MAP12-20]